MRALLRTFAPFAVAAALLAAAFLFVSYSAAVPASLAGVKVYGPYIVFALAAALATAFNRGRALFALLALVVAYAAQQAWLQQGLDAVSSRAVFVGMTVWVPAFLGLLTVLPERGTFNRHGAVRLCVLTRRQSPDGGGTVAEDGARGRHGSRRLGSFVTVSGPDAGPPR